MIERRLRVVKWLSTTPAVGVCTLCSREFKVPISALRRTADSQASLEEQFDRHKCEPVDSVLRREPDEEEDEEEDERKEEEDDDDDDEGDGYSE